MFAGHLGAGLLLKKPAPSANLGALFLAALGLDVILWVLILFGVESLHVPTDYRHMSDITFDFPWSHSLVAAIAWSAIAFLAAMAVFRGKQIVAFVIAAAVFSHFVLDWLVHVPEMPVLGQNSPKLGLGLWKNLPVALTVEPLIVAVGLWVYLRTAQLSRARTITLVALVVLVTVMTALGQISSSPAPAPVAAATSSLITIAVLVTAVWWIDRPQKR